MGIADRSEGIKLLKTIFRHIPQWQQSKKETMMVRHEAMERRGELISCNRYQAGGEENTEAA